MSAIPDEGADILKLRAETEKLRAETDKLRAESQKLLWEALKFKRESQWYPFVAGAGVFAAAYGFLKFLH